MSTSIITPVHTAQQIHGRAGFSLAGFMVTCRRVAQKCWLMYTIYNERRQMRKLSDEALRDMGISRADVELECSRKFLDIPNCRH